MAEKEMKMIVQIMGIIAVIFCGITLIVPWAGIDSGGAGVNAYPWGVTEYAPSISTWDFFFIDALQGGVNEIIVFSILMIITFILTLVALIIGIIGVTKISKKPSSSLLAAGIISIVAMILCAVAVAQINNIYIGVFAFGYGAGFVLIILAFILYILTYVMQKLMLTYALVPAGAQPMYQQPGQPQPQMMYTQQPQQPMQTPPPPQPQPTQPQPVQPPQQPQMQPQATPKFCPNCGAPLQPGYQFCDKCGNKF